MRRFAAFVLLLLSILIGINHGLCAGLVTASLSGAALMPMQRTGFCFAVGPISLLDLALRSGKGIHSLLQGVLTYAPEMMTFGALPMSGLTYSTLTCTSLPSGDFRAVGGGVGLQKSEWKKEIGSMVPFEAQMHVAEDVLIQAKSQNDTLTDGDILAAEAIRYVQGSAIRIGAQTWYGTKISADGFAGLSTQIDTANNEINAGGAGNANSSSVYLVDLDANPVNPQGVHYVVGNGGRMNFKDTWLEAREKVSSNPDKFANGFSNNFLAYMGLVVPRTLSIYRAKNVTAAFPFTDAMGADVLNLVPLALRANKSRFRWFMNSACALGLQKSRQATLTTDKGISSIGAFPAEPTEVQGIAIQLTDSLITTERAGLKP